MLPGLQRVYSLYNLLAKVFKNNPIIEHFNVTENNESNRIRKQN
jgi:hypothetical protein